MTCSDLPRLITQGEDKQGGMEQGEAAMEEVFATCMIEGVDFPTPSKPKLRKYLVAPPAETMAKAALCVAMR